VQDLPETSEKGKALFEEMPLDPSIKERIEFQAYDLNTTQTVTGADVYFFRTIFHNWPKSHCVRFLKNLVPALRPGSKILTNEIVLPNPGALSAWDSRIAQ
jgi:predicted O-methyltransferase YrrM